MKIEFPKKYRIEVSEALGMLDAYVDVPQEYIEPLVALFAQQEWIRTCHPFPSRIHLWISGAYEIDAQQTHDALCQLIEHVMDPTPNPELDPEIWKLDQ